MGRSENVGRLGAGGHFPPLLVTRGGSFWNSGPVELWACLAGRLEDTGDQAGPEASQARGYDWKACRFAICPEF